MPNVPVTVPVTVPAPVVVPAIITVSSSPVTVPAPVAVPAIVTISTDHRPLGVLDPQPDPLPGSGDIWLSVIPDLPPILRPYATERRLQGIERYGTPLQADNKRDALFDLFQEELDAIAYAAQVIAAGAAPRAWALAKLDRAIQTAEVTAQEIARRAEGSARSGSITESFGIFPTQYRIYSANDLSMVAADCCSSCGWCKTENKKAQQPGQ